ncbi:MAG: hypothetical protein IJU61_04720 [Victivallales bacterium]|nr:hypothetical protein [Victivallales bacterium]
MKDLEFSSSKKEDAENGKQSLGIIQNWISSDSHAFGYGNAFSFVRAAFWRRKKRTEDRPDCLSGIQ